MPGGGRINLEQSLGKVIEEIYKEGDLEKSKNSGLIKKLKMKKERKKKKK